MISTTSVRCAMADAAMSVRMIFRRSIARSWVADLLLAYSRPPSIPFRREAKIGQAALGAGERGNLGHLGIRELEIEDLDIFRQTLDTRRSGNRGHVLLHQPAQADLRRCLVMG